MPANSDALRSGELEPPWLPGPFTAGFEARGARSDPTRQERGDERGRVKAALVGGPQDVREDSRCSRPTNVIALHVWISRRRSDAF